MPYRPEYPLMIQADMSAMLEVNNPMYEEVRNGLSSFAELEKSPEHIHTYRISPLSLWNAASSGMKAEQIIDFIYEFSKFDVAPNVIREISDLYRRFGILKLEQEDEKLFLTSTDDMILREVLHYKSMNGFVAESINDLKVLIHSRHRGALKQELIKLGYPVQDLAGYVEGAALPIAWRQETLKGKPFSLRPYQQNAADCFYAGGSVYGGSGVLVLPCGAGKTIIGIAAAIAVQEEVLILTSSVTATRQWIHEILDKTDLQPDQIGEYSGDNKQIRPVTVATYQILSHRKDKHAEFTHLSLFSERNWGLIIYDEVHLLPAPVFRITAEIQAKRRVGLTATLVREDGMEKDVFSLIGPKKYDVPWKEMERDGWIATAQCIEVRVELSRMERGEYAVSDARTQARLAAEASEKLEVVQELVERHMLDQVLIIGQYLDQLDQVSELIGAPLITGKMPNRERELLYEQFKTGAISVLVVSKVANFAIDLPDANVAIQISGQFGSRQEEAQRLGRILRPKAEGVQAHFYSLVTKDTKDHEFAINRQRFLTEQGYSYTILDAEELSAYFGQVPMKSGSIPIPMDSSSTNLISLSDFRNKKMEATAYKGGN